jgi:hypothetical protein
MRVQLRLFGHVSRSAERRVEDCDKTGVSVHVSVSLLSSPRPHRHWNTKRHVLLLSLTSVTLLPCPHCANQVLSTVPVMFSYWARPEDCLDLCQILNNHVAAVVRGNPKRFVGAYPPCMLW